MNAGGKVVSRYYGSSEGCSKKGTLMITLRSMAKRLVQRLGRKVYDLWNVVVTCDFLVYTVYIRKPFG